MKTSFRLDVIDCTEPPPWLVPHWERIGEGDPEGRLFQSAVWILNYWRFRRVADDRFKLLLGRNAHDEVVSILPLVVENESGFLLPPNLGGVHAIGEYEADWTCPAHLSREFATAVLDYLSTRRKQWYLLKFHALRQDSHMLGSLRSECERRGLSFQMREGMEIPFRSTAGDTGSIDDELDGKYRRDLHRRQRQLEREAPLTFETFEDPGGLDEHLDEFFAVEASGWKGRAGTAISSTAHIERFWRTFAVEAASRGRLRLTLLRSGEVVIAGQLGITFRRTYYCLKTGYDETYSRYGPGALTTRRVIQDCMDDPLIDIYDFAGARSPYMEYWASQWTPTFNLAIASPHPGYRTAFNTIRRGRRLGGALRRALRSVTARRSEGGTAESGRG